MTIQMEWVFRVWFAPRDVWATKSRGGLRRELLSEVRIQCIDGPAIGVYGVPPNVDVLIEADGRRAEA